MSTLLKASHAESAACALHLVLLDRETYAYDLPDWITVEQLDSGHSLWKSTFGLLAVLRRLRPQATLSFLTRANVATVVASRLLGIPAIVSERVNTSSHLGRGIGASLARLLVKWCYPAAHKIIAVSPGVADDLKKSFHVPADKVAVIANPIDIDDIYRQGKNGKPYEIGRTYVMAMGRLVPNKNFAMLIEAFSQAQIKEDLLILGEGPQRDVLENLVSKRGLTGRVHLPGFSDNPFATLQKAEFFVLPSNAEGFPNSLLEAMSLGVPVISTNCMSGPSEVLANLPREAVQEGVCFADHGILVTPDHIGDMAVALQSLADPERRKQYGALAAVRAAEFGVQRAKNAYWRIIQAELCDTLGNANRRSIAPVSS
jgi:N-acetylgalactosamine-N,N'-diacetylbacillosaminyl-diphospho-undecaprenol 4-alpha-N-acetylgalactosaminyltransferase